MVIPPNYVCDFHVNIIHNYAKVVRGCAVAPGDDQIIQLFIADDHPTSYRIIKLHRPLEGVLKPYYRFHIWSFRIVLVPAVTVVAWFNPLSPLLLTYLIQLFSGAITAVGLSGIQQLSDNLFISLKTVALIDRALIIIQPHPCHSIKDCLDRFNGRTLLVCVFDSQDKRTATVTGV